MDTSLSVHSPNKRTPMKLKFFIILFISGFTKISAQIYFPDISLSHNFQCQIKSLDEFQARFNGIESNLDILDDSLSRRNNLLALFDFDMKPNGLTTEELAKNVNSFVDSVLNKNIAFHISDAGLLAECLCRITYNGYAKKITLLFQRETTQDKQRHRWGIIGVKGLPEAGIINLKRYYTISPVEHEIHFMGLIDLFNENSSHAMGYRSQQTRIDQLSVFLTLVQTGNIKFDLVEKQIFHYIDVPGYVFTIEEITRNTTNSGWLISSLIPCSENDKLKYLDKLFDYEQIQEKH